MPASWGRPVDTAKKPPGWRSGAAVFTLDDLDAADAAAVLRQWAVAERARLLISVSQHRTVRQFAKQFELSEDRLHSFINGQRLATFGDEAVLAEQLQPNWPDEKYIQGRIKAARERSEKAREIERRQRLRREPASSLSLMQIAELSSSEPSEPDGVGVMNDPHPDRALLTTTVTSWLLAQPEVIDHLAAGGGEMLEVEVTAVTCEPGLGHCDIWIGESQIAGVIAAPEDWRERVRPACRDRFPGTVALEVLKEGDSRPVEIIGTAVVVEGESAAEGDVRIESQVMRWQP